MFCARYDLGLTVANFWLMVVLMALVNIWQGYRLTVIILIIVRRIFFIINVECGMGEVFDESVKKKYYGQVEEKSHSQTAISIYIHLLRYYFEKFRGRHHLKRVCRKIFSTVTVINTVKNRTRWMIWMLWDTSIFWPISNRKKHHLCLKVRNLS